MKHCYFAALELGNELLASIGFVFKTRAPAAAVCGLMPSEFIVWPAVSFDQL